MQIWPSIALQADGNASPHRGEHPFSGITPLYVAKSRLRDVRALACMNTPITCLHILYSYKFPRRINVQLLLWSMSSMTEFSFINMLVLLATTCSIRHWQCFSYAQLQIAESIPSLRNGSDFPAAGRKYRAEARMSRGSWLDVQHVCHYQQQTQ